MNLNRITHNVNSLIHIERGQSCTWAKHGFGPPNKKQNFLTKTITFIFIQNFDNDKKPKIH
jgi:hypothetical protein